jgi:hypothetical protein
MKAQVATEMVKLAAARALMQVMKIEVVQQTSTRAAEAEETLALDEKKRRRTVIRVDAGGGSLDDVNWCLERVYHFHGKTFSNSRAEELAATVAQCGTWTSSGRISRSAGSQ